MKYFSMMALATGVALAAATPASAAIILAVGVNGAAPVQVATDSGSGFANYSVSQSGYTISFQGSGFPSIVQPNLLTNALSIALNGQSAAGSLQLYITQTDLNAFNGSLMSTFNSNALSGSVSSATVTSYYSSSNALFGGTQLQTTTFTGLDVYAGANVFSAAGPFSETVKYDIVFTGGAGTFNGTANLTAVPEPATWAMMMLGFGALGAVLRTRRRSTTARIRFA